MPVHSMSYLRYSPSLEKPAPDEPVIFDELSRIMQHITRTMASRYRHAYCPVHTKFHGVLVRALDVLPEPLAQGLFSKPASYPVVLRFSTNPGDLLADNVSSPCGLAIKIVNSRARCSPPTPATSPRISSASMPTPSPRPILPVSLADQDLRQNLQT